MDKLLTKNIVFCASALVALLSWIANYFAIADHETLYILYTFFFAVTLTLLITYFSPKISEIWIKFLLGWTPLSLVFIFLDSSYNSLFSPGSMRLTRILAVSSVVYCLFFFVINKVGLRYMSISTTAKKIILYSVHVVAFILSLFLGLVIANLFKA
jgi:hypothetical protein